MLNLLYLFFYVLYIYLIIKLYFFYNIEFQNIFIEIKNFLFQKLNLNSNFAMENNIIEQKPQKNLIEFNNKEYYNKKEIILISVGSLIVCFCLYIFFKNITPANDIIEQIPQVIQEVPQVIQEVPQVPVYENAEWMNATLNYTWERDVNSIFRRSILNYGPTFSFRTTHNHFRIELAEVLLNSYPDLPFENPFSEAQRLINLYQEQINTFINSKRGI